MRNILTTICAIILFSNSLQALDASVSFATFKNGEQNYVEVYLTIIGKTVEYKTIDSLQYQANVEVLLLFKKGEEIVNFDKYALNSPMALNPINFVDMKRYALENGDYTLEASLRDLNDTTNVQSFALPLKMNFNNTKILQSDIQLLAAASSDASDHPLVKNGIRMEALPYNYCHKQMSVLHFYNEIYNTDKLLTDDFMLSYSIEKRDGKGNYRTVSIGHKRRSPKPVNPFLMQMDISNLKSGQYRLRIEVRDRTKALLSEKIIEFDRANPFLDTLPTNVADFELAETFVANMTAEELRYSLKGIAPIVANTEVERLNFVINDADLERQKRFLFNYWASRNANHPEAEYKGYMEVVRAVDNKYKSGFGYGFETDRGHIFLKYGKPHDVIAVEDEPIAPPYEIWSYNRIDKINQSNVKFLFYNPTYASGDYRLLHSTARGEVSNPQWQLELYKQAPDQVEGADYLNATQVKDGLNRKAARYFNDF